MHENVHEKLMFRGEQTSWNLKQSCAAVAKKTGALLWQKIELVQKLEPFHGTYTELKLL
jgi:hypothetical protein